MRKPMPMPRPRRRKLRWVAQIAEVTTQFLIPRKVMTRRMFMNPGVVKRIHVMTTEQLITSRLIRMRVLKEKWIRIQITGTLPKRCHIMPSLY